MPTLIPTKNLLGTYGTMYYVKDMSAAVNWYKALGLQPSCETEEWVEFPVNGHSICLHLTDSKEKTGNGILILHVANLPKVVADLRQQNVKITDDITEVHPGAFSASIIDNDNNVISLYEGPKNLDN